MYKVIKFFVDLEDNNFPYNVGDVFPRNGKEVSENRLKELAGKDNKQGQPLIKLIDEPKAEAPAKPAEKKPAAKKPAAKKTAEK